MNASFAMARGRTPEQRAKLLMKAVTMAEIHKAAELLGLTFREAYRERAGLYEFRWGVRAFPRPLARQASLQGLRQ